MTKFRAACEDRQTEERAVVFFFEGHNRTTRRTQLCQLERRHMALLTTRPRSRLKLKVATVAKDKQLR